MIKPLRFLIYLLTIGCGIDAAFSAVGAANGEIVTARIINVDTSQRTLTLQIRDTSRLFYTSQNAFNRQTRQPLAFAELTIGQVISITWRPRPDGHFEITSLLIMRNGSASASGGGIHGGPVEVSAFK